MKYHITWYHFLGVFLVHIFCFDKHLCKSLQRSVVFIRDLFLTFLISYLFKLFIDKRDCNLETSEIVIRDMYNELHRGVTYAKVRIAIPGTAKWAQISGHFLWFILLISLPYTLIDTITYSCVFFYSHLSLRGHSSTTWTEFCHFLTPPPLRGQFLYPKRGQKQTFFDPLPHLVHVLSYWMAPKFNREKADYC